MFLQPKAGVNIYTALVGYQARQIKDKAVKAKNFALKDYFEEKKRSYD